MVMVILKLVLLTCMNLSVIAHARPSHPSPQQTIPDDTFITLERSQCLGPCPVYKLTISANGRVTFEGRGNVRQKGIVKGKITREQLQQLLGEFEKVNYFMLKDRYEREADGCPGVWTDNPTALTSIRMNGKTKSIAHYYGCQKDRAIYPEGLTALESRIDEIVGTEKWIK